MSVARVRTVKRARKNQGICGKCGTPLPAGGPYLWYTVGFRGRYKNKRCMDQKCYPSPSERESSLLAAVMVAQEEFDVTECETVDDFRAAMEPIIDALNEVSEQYREAGTNDAGVEWSPSSIERADMLESAANDLESWEPSEAEPLGCPDHEDNETGIEVGCDECATLRDGWLDAIQEDAVGAIEELELP